MKGTPSSVFQEGGYWAGVAFSSVQFSSVAQSCPTLCEPMDCSMPDLPAHHQLPELTQTRVHWVGDVEEGYWAGVTLVRS